ncbi:MAG: glycerol acyltransferase [Gammaproteobacteria bacterium]|nr:glycerol acyltransferase [Gammaproteobacteria bacterium]
MPGMVDFEGIRPYQDGEVPGVLARLARDADLQAVLGQYLFPRATRLLPQLGRLLGGRLLRRLASRLRTVRDVQLFLSGHMEALIDKTIFDFSVSGVERLSPGTPYLFISTHRDIIMDTGLVNFAIHRAGHATTRIAIGDNLLGKHYAADLMRLNKSFVIERSVTGAKAVYRALNRTSDFIRASLEAAESVWIAQREGRAKDGLDRTDPALVKMLTLAWRKEAADPCGLCGCINIVPVAITYELDPCALRKARELCITDLHGKYDKPDGEDFSSIVEGMLGFKGRVHLHFGAPLEGGFDSPEALADAIDREIVDGLKVFPTHVEAARRLGDEALSDAVSPDARVEAAFQEQIAACPAALQPYFLQQYANLIRNKRRFGVGI